MRTAAAAAPAARPLEVTASVPGATEAGFQEAAGNAKKGCPISRLLNTEITMNARLEG